MLETSNPAIDIDALLERIRQEVARHKGRLPNVDSDKCLPTLSVGSVLHFGENGNATAHLRSGWGSPESEHQWTDGREAEIVFEVPPIENDLLLTFAADPLIGGKVEAQHVQAEWNGVLVGEWTIRQPGTYATIVWARHLQASRLVSLRFVLHSAFSPVSAGMNADPRLLGLCFRELRLLPVSDLGV